MQAVVFKGPKQVAVETRPRPEIKEDTDAIVKVRYSALCGRQVVVQQVLDSFDLVAN